MTTIKLQDGVEYEGRTITSLTLRPFIALDHDYFSTVGTMRGALVMLARLTGEPFDALSTMTQDDVHDALLGLNAHVDKAMANRRPR